MLRALRLLMMLSVLWCGLHFDDPAQAYETVEQHQLHVEAASPSDSQQGPADGPSEAAHTGHQHCPLAPDQGSDPLRCAIAEGDELPAPQPASALVSRSQAPPLQPPAA